MLFFSQLVQSKESAPSQPYSTSNILFYPSISCVYKILLLIKGPNMTIKLTGFTDTYKMVSDTVLQTPKKREES